MNRANLSFEENVGQTAAQVKYLARGSGYTLFLTDGEAVFALNGPTRSSAVRMQFTGAGSTARVSAEERAEGVVSYFRGSDPTRWHTAIPTYKRVRYDGVYPGVDTIFYGTGTEIEYDFVVAPGADPRAIRLRFDGTRGVRVDDQGALVLATDAGDLRQNPPVVYQQEGSGKHQVTARYDVDGDGTVSLDLGEYDASTTLVIDPQLVFATYVGDGYGSDSRLFSECDCVLAPRLAGKRVALDSAGSVYTVGTMSTPDFPVTSGVRDGRTVFVTKLSPDGSNCVYSVLLGDWTSGYAGSLSIALDDSGCAYIAGSGGSLEITYPVTEGAVNAGDIFVTKVSVGGTELDYSARLAGDSISSVASVAVDKSGCAYVTGAIDASLIRFPEWTLLGGGFNSHPETPVNAFVQKLNEAGSAMVYRAVFGADKSIGYDIAVDEAGCAYITGGAWWIEASFPVTPGAYNVDRTSNSGAFVAKLTPDGTALVFSTLLRADDDEFGCGIEVDESGCAYVVGFFQDPSNGDSTFPQDDRPDLFDYYYFTHAYSAFLMKLNPSGSALVYSTVLDSGADDQAWDVAIDASGNAYITGVTAGADFPMTAGAYDATYGGGFADTPPPLPITYGYHGNATFYTGDSFVTKIGPSGEVAYSTFLGSSGADRCFGIAVDSTGGVYVSGETYSSDFATTGLGTRSSPAAFVAKLNLNFRTFGGFQQPINADGSSIFRLGSTVPVKFRLTDTAGAPVANAVVHLYTAQVSNGITGTQQEAVSTSEADIGNTFRYLGNGQYVFNLGTSGLSVGTWELRALEETGVVHTIRVSLRAR